MKKHFYLFVFQYFSNPLLITKSTYVGYDDQFVTLPRISTAKMGEDIQTDAALIGLSYLGHMTQDDFKNKK